MRTAPPFCATQRAKADRIAKHPAADAIGKLVAFWNEIRERATPTARKVEIVAEVLSTVGGRLQEVTLRHDTARCIQACLKFGNAEQRATIAKELFTCVLELSKAKHGHQTVERMLRYGSPAVRAAVALELKGHVARLSTHALGALVLEVGFTKAWTPAQTWDLFQELYGAEYVHFKAELVSGAAVPKKLASLIAAAPDKSRRILENVHHTLVKMADKGLFSLVLAQRLLAEFIDAAPPEAAVAAIALAREQVLSLVASREGARAASRIFALGTARERKAAIKALKGHMLDVACHVHGHMVLIAALAYTDDTKLSASAILGELAPHCAYLACHKYGKRVLLSLCVEWGAPQRRYFSEYDLSLIAPAELPAYLMKRKGPEGAGEDGDAPPAAAAAGGVVGAKRAKGAVEETEEVGPSVAGGAGAARAPTALPPPPSADLLADPAAMVLVPTSKKSPVVKRAELLAAFTKELEAVAVSHTAVLARSEHGALVLFEIACALGAARPSTLDAIVALVREEPSPAVIAAQVKALNAAAAAASAAHSASEGGGKPVAPIGADPVPAGKSKKFDDDDAAPAAAADDDMGAGGAAAGDESSDEEDEEGDDGVGAVVIEEDVLPILEFLPSHTLFMRLLSREAVARADRAKSAAAAQPAPPHFGSRLAAALAGSIASIAKQSNRSGMAIVELLSSADASVSGRIRAELKAAKLGAPSATDSPAITIIRKKLA